MLKMWQNYLTVAVRALARHKVYSSSTSSAWRSASPPACSSLAIALGTIAGHAMKVARLNPVHALRYE